METLPFLYFIPHKPKVLILGSFPCIKEGSYGDWFYSGSGKNQFWSLLSTLFEMPANDRKEKQALCEKYGLALSDIALKIERKKNNCSDANLRILAFNTRSIQKCLDTGVTHIFCTSRFVESHFRKLFPENTLPVSLLVSPSPAANRHIGGLKAYRQLIASGMISGPFEYRLISYRILKKACEL